MITVTLTSDEVIQALTNYINQNMLRDSKEVASLSFRGYADEPHSAEDPQPEGTDDSFILTKVDITLKPAAPKKFESQILESKLIPREFGGMEWQKPWPPASDGTAGRLDGHNT